jgi:hypothetical protein
MYSLYLIYYMYIYVLNLESKVKVKKIIRSNLEFILGIPTFISFHMAQ